MDADGVRAADEVIQKRLQHPHKTGGSAGGGGWLGNRSTQAGEVGALPPPFELAVLAGGCASAAVDVCIYPIDTLKTRLQAPQGFRAAGGYRGLFSGVSAAALGAVPGGALFFGSYEFTRSALSPNQSAAYSAWSLDAIAACAAATASCVLRTPAIVVQQRMQVGQYPTLISALRGISAEGGASAFYSGLGVSIAREIPFAFIQFPVYEGLKRMWIASSGSDLSPLQGAVCGSIAGSAAAAATTPLDVLKTRQMLGGAQNGIVSEVRTILREEGPSGLLKGMGPRVGWMALGGYIFFGVYAQCLNMLLAVYPREPDKTRIAQPADSGARSGAAAGGAANDAVLAAGPALGAAPTSEPVPAHVALLAGGLAGMVIDFALFPIDTIKTRTIQGLATDLTGAQGGMTLLGRMGELSRLWNGVSAAMLPAIPSASAFFVTYEGVKRRLGSDDPSESSAKTFAKHSLAAATAEVVCVTIRVPNEFLKLKLQSSQEKSFAMALQSAWRQGGVLALYRGFGATICLDLPFALLQFPLYEHIKSRIALQRRADGEGGSDSSSVAAADGALAGALAGATAAFFTTPLDVMRTRHVLWQGKRMALSETVARVYRLEGVRGFWRGVLPRTVYMAMGGALYLGTYSFCCGVFARVNSV